MSRPCSTSPSAAATRALRRPHREPEVPRYDPAPMAARTGTKAIDRAAQLLVRVVESADHETVGELAETTGLPRSTASRLVAALERQGLVQRDGQRGDVRPGPVLVSFARRTTPATELVDLCEEPL